MQMLHTLLANTCTVHVHVCDNYEEMVNNKLRERLFFTIYLNWRHLVSVLLHHVMQQMFTLQGALQ